MQKNAGHAETSLQAWGWQDRCSSAHALMEPFVMSTTVSSASEMSIAAALDGAPKVDLLPNLRLATAAGRRAFDMVREFLALSRGPGRITPHEYFYYRLWELAPAERVRFVGKRAQQKMHTACNDPRWFAVVHDKVLFHAAMLGAGFPVPRLVAIHHPTRRLPGIPSLNSAEELAAFLRRRDIYPLFGKPIDGMFSLGTFGADAWLPEDDSVVFHDGTCEKVADLAARLAERQAGHLLQERLEAHPELEAVFGRRLSSVRLFVLLTPNGPVIARAVSKIPTGSNIADNFWRAGNLLGAVELDSGEVRRVVRGVGADMTVNPSHPDTGLPILGLRLPLWNQIKELCQSAALTLPGVRTQSWDVAMTRNGPVLLEVNFGGDVNLAQLAWGAGVLDDTYRAHLRTCGYRGKV